MKYFDVVANRQACLCRDVNYLAETTKNTNRKWNSDLLGVMISLICFKIFKSKWYQNALIGVLAFMRAKPTRKDYWFSKQYFWNTEKTVS